MLDHLSSGVRESEHTVATPIQKVIPSSQQNRHANQTSKTQDTQRVIRQQDMEKIGEINQTACQQNNVLYQIVCSQGGSYKDFNINKVTNQIEQVNKQ